MNNPHAGCLFIMNGGTYACKKEREQVQVDEDCIDVLWIFDLCAMRDVHRFIDER